MYIVDKSKNLLNAVSISYKKKIKELLFSEALFVEVIYVSFVTA